MSFCFSHPCTHFIPMRTRYIGTQRVCGDGFQLELVAVRIRQNHLEEACRVSLLDVMKQHLACEAEAGAIAHAVEMGVLRPLLQGVSQSALLDQLLEAFINLLVHLLKLPMECWTRMAKVLAPSAVPGTPAQAPNGVLVANHSHTPQRVPRVAEYVQSRPGSKSVPSSAAIGHT